MSGGTASKDADTSWKAYLPLWAALIKGEGLPVQDAALHSRLQLWSQPLYDALLTAVLDALRNLDLEYHQTADVPDTLDSHAAPVEITDQVLAGPRTLLCVLAKRGRFDEAAHFTGL